MCQDARRFVSAKLPSKEESNPFKFVENTDRCEPFFKFLEGVTNKSFGTMPIHKDEVKPKKFVPLSTSQRNYTLASKCYESAIQICNSNSMPPVSLMAKLDMNTKIGSKVANQSDVLGGSYDTQRLLKCNLPIPDCTENHVKIIDNAQKGKGKYQKKQRLKLDQKASVSVYTNIIVAVPEKFLGSDIFKKIENLPSSFEEHPLFNPRTADDFPELIEILEEKRNAEKKEKNKILKRFYEEVLVDIEIGRGISSVEKMLFLNSNKTEHFTIVCSHCHHRHLFVKTIENICPQCQSNPSYYKLRENGPYEKFGIYTDPKKSEVYFQDPKPLNPVGDNLVTIYNEFNDKKPTEDVMFATGQDGLINVAYHRNKRKVHCSTHGETFGLWEESKRKAHTKADCSWKRPMENLFNIEGPSHELMTMGINYMKSLKPFGINEYVKEQGFVSEAAQESVMKGKFLRRLLEILIPFTEGAQKTLILGFINRMKSENLPFSFDQYISFMQQCPNLKSRALHNITYNLGLSVHLKHLALRLSRSDISAVVSANFTLASLLFNNTMYRESYLYLFIHEGHVAVNTSGKTLKRPSRSKEAFAGPGCLGEGATSLNNEVPFEFVEPMERSAGVDIVLTNMSSRSLEDIAGVAVGEPFGINNVIPVEDRQPMERTAGVNSVIADPMDSPVGGNSVMVARGREPVVMSTGFISAMALSGMVERTSGVKIVMAAESREAMEMAAGVNSVVGSGFANNVTTGVSSVVVGSVSSAVATSVSSVVAASFSYVVDAGDRDSMERTASGTRVMSVGDQDNRNIASEITKRIKEFCGDNQWKEYNIKHKFMTKDLLEFKNEVSIIDRSGTGSAGQGLDFVQEEFLKKGMSCVKMGKIVSYDVFREGIRNSYYSDKTKPKKMTQRNKRHFKWELEVKSASMILMNSHDVFEVGEETDLGHLDADLLHFEEKGLDNLKQFYTKFISGKLAPSSIKLEPLFVTEKERLDSQNIATKTKAEIMIKMKEMDLEAIDIFVAEDIETLRKRKFNPDRFKKDELITIYEVLNRAQQEYLLLLEVEKTLL